MKASMAAAVCVTLSMMLTALALASGQPILFAASITLGFVAVVLASLGLRWTR